MTYRVTYASGKKVVMHNSQTKNFERILRDRVKDGFILSWERDQAAAKAEREFRKAFTPNKYGELA